MKKTILTVSLLCFVASTALMAQDDKKQEPKKEEKKEEKPKTRMAINEKGLPGNGTKQGNGQKSTGTGTTSGTGKKEDHK